jgi:phytoene synthase
METTDLEVCREALRRGSRSFTAASLLLPPGLRAPAAALYAFCRVADDAVDEGDGAAGLARLRHRLDRVYAGAPRPDPVDRAFAAVVRAAGIPRTVPDLLLEGFAWDVAGRRYETASDVTAYGVRVAGTVGVMMTLLMGRRDGETLARACEMGVAMQLTNIARDVGEDARRGRLYLPRQWMREAGLDPDAWLADPRFDGRLADVVRRLLATADGLYRSAEPGIARLPRRARVAIRAAGLIYRDIGRVVARNGYDSVGQRASTGALRKAWLLARSLGAALGPAHPAPGPALPEARALVAAVAS